MVAHTMSGTMLEAAGKPPNWLPSAPPVFIGCISEPCRDRCSKPYTTLASEVGGDHYP
jgi:hypothetical protein